MSPSLTLSTPGESAHLRTHALYNWIGHRQGWLLIMTGSEAAVLDRRDALLVNDPPCTRRELHIRLHSDPWPTHTP